MSKRKERIRTERRFDREDGLTPERCVACDERLSDPRYLIPGVGGILRHECPTAYEAGLKAAETRASEI